MSTTLARKLRRIGLTRTFHTVQQIVLTKDEQGNDTEGVITREVSERQHIYYSPEELPAIRAKIIAEWRAKRKKAR